MLLSARAQKLILQSYKAKVLQDFQSPSDEFLRAKIIEFEKITCYKSPGANG